MCHLLLVCVCVTNSDYCSHCDIVTGILTYTGQVAWALPLRQVQVDLIHVQEELSRHSSSVFLVNYH